MGMIINPYLVQPSGPTYDADAQAFFTAASITDTTQKDAVNQLVLDLKSYSIWSKMKALYPFVGGTATTHKYNLKDPQDTDAAFRLVFNGGGTHSSTGYLPNGTNGYGDTKLNPSSSLTNNNTHLSFYSRTSTITNLQRDIGIYQSGDNPCIALGTNTGVQLSDHYNYNTNRISASISSADGFYIGTRTTSTSHKLYKNNSTLGTDTSTNSMSLPNGNAFIGGVNLTNLGIIYSTKECAFASIGDGLTDTEAANFYTAVQTFETTLGRQVGVPIVSDSDAQAFLNAAVITDTTQASAVNQLVTDLKGYGIWTKMKALYPFVGGSSSSHKYNLKDPRDLDAAFRLVFSGGWTHSSTGALPNGTNGTSDTKVNSDATAGTMSQNDAHISFYSTKDNRDDVYRNDMAAGGNFYLSSNYHKTSYPGIITNLYVNGFNGVTSNTDARGFYVNSRTSSTLSKTYKNASVLITDTRTSSNSSGNILIGSAPGSEYSIREFAFASIGTGLSSTDVSNLYTAVQAFQTTLSRNV